MIAIAGVSTVGKDGVIINGQCAGAATPTPPGALFGLATSVDADGNQVIYLNDDNAAAVLVLASSASSANPPTPYGTPRPR